MEKNRSRFGLKMLVMPTIILLLVSFYPLFNSIYLSVTNTNILKKGQTCLLYTSDAADEL